MIRRAGCCQGRQQWALFDLMDWVQANGCLSPFSPRWAKIGAVRFDGMGHVVEWRSQLHPAHRTIGNARIEELLGLTSDDVVLSGLIWKRVLVLPRIGIGPGAQYVSNECRQSRPNRVASRVHRSPSGVIAADAARVPPQIRTCGATASGSS